MNDQPQDQQPPVNPAVQPPPKLEPEEEVFAWTAPNRPFKKRNKEFFSTVFLIVVLVSLILFFANQFLPIAVVISLGFLSYVLASVPPEMIKNRITNYGIHSDQHMAFWDEMGRFWFTKKFQHHLLHLETTRFPYRMMLLLDDAQKATVQKILDEYLIQETPQPGWMDQAANWLQEKIPLDREEAAAQRAQHRPQSSTQPSRPQGQPEQKAS